MWRSSHSRTEPEDVSPCVKTGGGGESRETRVDKFVGLMAESREHFHVMASIFSLETEVYLLNRKR